MVCIWVVIFFNLGLCRSHGEFLFRFNALKATDFYFAYRRGYWRTFFWLVIRFRLHQRNYSYTFRLWNRLFFFLQYIFNFIVSNLICDLFASYTRSFDTASIKLILFPKEIFALDSKYCVYDFLLEIDLYLNTKYNTIRRFKLDK